MLGDNTETIKKKKSLTETTKKVGLEVNIEKIKYVLVSRY
jgi:hypothetical protein